MIPLWSIPFAVGTGNTLVLKPSERTTGASMMLAEYVLFLIHILAIPDTLFIPLADMNASRLTLTLRSSLGLLVKPVRHICRSSINFNFPIHTHLSFNNTGLPKGVLNIVHGTKPTVNAICDHPDIRAISFVGGDTAGKHIYER